MREAGVDAIDEVWDSLSRPAYVTVAGEKDLTMTDTDMEESGINSVSNGEWMGSVNSYNGIRSESNTSIKSNESNESNATNDMASLMTRVRLIDQGSFGCIYRPDIGCDDMNSKRGSPIYVSKVQRMSKTIANEIEIGVQLRALPHYIHMYSPILHTCPVRIERLRAYEGLSSNERCGILRGEGKFISSRIRYVGDYIVVYLGRIPRLVCVHKIVTTYMYMESSLGRLWEAGIVHNDIKENNVLYDEYGHCPILIDFGISFRVSDLQDDTKERAIFYTTKYYPYWCIQVYILCQMANGAEILDGEVITESALVRIYDMYSGEMRAYMEDVGVSDRDIESIMKGLSVSYMEYMRGYIGKSWRKDLRYALLDTVGMWDHYSLAMTYMGIIGKLKIVVPDAFIEKLKSRLMRIA